MRSLLTTQIRNFSNFKEPYVIVIVDVDVFLGSFGVCTNCGTIESEDAIVFYFLPDNATALYFHTTKD